MELGALVCTPRAPRCPSCPVRAACAAHASGEPQALPVRKPAAAPRKIAAVAALLARDGRILAVRRPPAGLLGGLWDLPGGLLAPREAPAQGLARCLREGVGLSLHGAAPLGRVRHQFTHRDLTLHVFRAEALPGRVVRQGFDAHRWVSRAAFSRLGLPAVARKALALADPPRML
jgi:A/G-specific adenine glycosylase